MNFCAIEVIADENPAGRLDKKLFELYYEYVNKLI